MGRQHAYPRPVLHYALFRRATTWPRHSVSASSQASPVPQNTHADLMDARSRAQTEEFEASQAQRYSPDEPNAETTRGTSPSSSPVNEGLAKQPSQQHTKEPQDQTPPIDESQSYIFRRISNQMRRSRTRTPGEMSEDDQHLQRNVRNMEVNREAQFVRFMGTIIP